VPFVGKSKATSGELLSGNDNSNPHYSIDNNDNDYNNNNNYNSVYDLVYDSVDAKVYNNNNIAHYYRVSKNVTKTVRTKFHS
jgi:hypothetical protein